MQWVGHAWRQFCAMLKAGVGPCAAGAIVQLGRDLLIANETEQKILRLSPHGLHGVESVGNAVPTCPAMRGLVSACSLKNANGLGLRFATGTESKRAISLVSKASNDSIALLVSPARRRSKTKRVRVSSTRSISCGTSLTSAA